MAASQSILDSWQSNAGNWIQTIDHQEIESRRLVTNHAIVEAVLNLQPCTVLDVGCGEGWLTRALSEHNIEVTGVDAIESLIENARTKGAGTFLTATYREIATGILFSGKTFDLVVINFALLDQEETELLIHYLPNIIHLGGHLVIQTLHPLSVVGNLPYRSGWQPGSWDGMKRNFVKPYDWYFRTLGDWVRLLRSAGLSMEDLIEPLHPQTEQPASLILVTNKTLTGQIG